MRTTPRGMRARNPPHGAMKPRSGGNRNIPRPQDLVRGMGLENRPTPMGKANCTALSQRPVNEFIETVESLEGRAIGFRSLTDSIDATTVGGKLTFHIFASLAALERFMMRERTRAGLDAARARGPSLTRTWRWQTL